MAKEKPPSLEKKKRSAEEHLRLFFAVPLWDSFREGAMDRYKELQEFGWRLKWVRPENWHLTMKFLGNVPRVAVPGLEESVREKIAGHPPFTVGIGGLGGFPRPSRARVVWVGVREGREPLVELAKAVHEGCSDAGFPGDKKPFQPHFTLARAKKDPVAIRVPDSVFKAHWGERLVDSVSLVRSTLQPTGAVYETLVEISLEGHGPP